MEVLEREIKMKQLGTFMHAVHYALRPIEKPQASIRKKLVWQRFVFPTEIGMANVRPSSSITRFPQNQAVNRGYGQITDLCQLFFPANFLRMRASYKPQPSNMPILIMTYNDTNVTNSSSGKV